MDVLDQDDHVGKRDRLLVEIEVGVPEQNCERRQRDDLLNLRRYSHPFCSEQVNEQRQVVRMREADADGRKNCFTAFSQAC